jgi:hypothetical protein
LEITLKALSFFEDGDLGTVPNAVRDRLTAAVRAVDLDTFRSWHPAPRRVIRSAGDEAP